MRNRQPDKHLDSRSAKKAYQEPRLTEYGRIARLAQGASGQKGDKGTGVGKRT